jgi:diketogulonate reductase-like aldo/keto reductase
MAGVLSPDILLTVSKGGRSMDMITLNNGVQMPAIGVWTYKSTKDDGTGLFWTQFARVIAIWIRRHSMKMRKSRQSRQGSGIPREEFFLTSKLNRNFLGYESAKMSSIQQ